MSRNARTSLVFLFGSFWIIAVWVHRMPPRLVRQLEENPKLRQRVQAVANTLVEMNQTTGQTKWLPKDAALPDTARDMGAKSFVVTPFAGLTVVKIETSGPETIVVFPQMLYSPGKSLMDRSDWHDIGDGIVITK